MACKSSRSVTSVEVLGFVSWTASAAAFVLYLIWAYVPAQTLESFGVTYYPSKYWATALPLWFCLALTFCFVAYERAALAVLALAVTGRPMPCSANLMLVEPLWSRHTVTDEYAKVSRASTNGGMAPLADLPLAEVCDVLYGAL